MQATGTSPTTVRMKVWKLGTTEPAAWTLTTTDTTANLQAVGSTGISTYLSGSATNAPIVLTVDNYVGDQSLRRSAHAYLVGSHRVPPARHLLNAKDLADARYFEIDHRRRHGRRGAAVARALQPRVPAHVR